MSDHEVESDGEAEGEAEAEAEAEQESANEEEDDAEAEEEKQLPVAEEKQNQNEPKPQDYLLSQLIKKKNNKISAAMYVHDRFRLHNTHCLCVCGKQKIGTKTKWFRICFNTPKHAKSFGNTWNG
jgi:hypothetical protein